MRDHHERERRAKALRLLDRLGQRRDQPRAIELAGQRILLRQLHQLFVARMPFVDRAHDAVRRAPACRRRRRTSGRFPRSRPAARKPQAASHTRPDRERRRPRVAARSTTFMMASRRIDALRLDALGEFGAGGERIGGKIRQQRRDARAPGDGVGGDVPDEFGVLDAKPGCGRSEPDRKVPRTPRFGTPRRTPQRMSVFDTLAHVPEYESGFRYSRTVKLSEDFGKRAVSAHKPVTTQGAARGLRN